MHNHLVCVAGTGKEGHPDLVAYYRLVASQIADIEARTFTIHDSTYTVSLELLPVDQKFVAILAGELSNSATYSSTFAYVNQGK